MYVFSGVIVAAFLMLFKEKWKLRVQTVSLSPDNRYHFFADQPDRMH